MEASQSFASSLWNSWWMIGLRISTPILLAEAIFIFLAILTFFAVRKQVDFKAAGDFKAKAKLFFVRENSIAAALITALLTIHGGFTAVSEQRLLLGLVDILRATSGQPGGQQAQGDPIAQARASFVNDLEQNIVNPDKTPVEALKKALLEKYAGLFPRGAADKAVYAQNIIGAYNCQREVLEDFIRAMQTKKASKSDARKACEANNLIAPDRAKGNEELVNKFARGETITDPSRNNAPITADDLRASVEVQNKRIEIVKQILLK